MFNRRKKFFTSSHLTQLSREIDPDEIFLDAKNLPGFNKDQFEGRIEKPIGKSVIAGTAMLFLFIEILFFYKVFNLQVIHGTEYLAKSENNRLNIYNHLNIVFLPGKSSHLHIFEPKYKQLIKDC